MNPRARLRLATALAAFLAASTAGSRAADLPDADTVREQLAGPVTIDVGTGREVSGRIARVHDNQLMIRSSVAGGEVTQTFPFERIRSILLPGDDFHAQALDLAENGRPEAAAALLDLLFAQRASLLALLPEAEIHRYIRLVELQLETGHAARALAVAEQVRAHTDTPRAVDALDDAVLEARFRLGMTAEAQALAADWLSRRDGYGGSVLGFAVLAAVALDEGEAESALETALEAAVFSPPDGAAHLEACYAVAVQASCELRDFTLARRLAAEMSERDLDWPVSLYPDFSTKDIPEPSK